MTDFQPLVVESLLTRADFAALQHAWSERARARVGRARLMGATIAPLVVAAVLVPTLRLGDFAFLALLIGVLAMLVGTAWASLLLRRWSVPDEDGLLLGRVRTELSSDGIRSLRGHSSSFVRWSALKDVTCTGSHVFLWVDRLSAFIIPARDLPEGLDARAAAESIRGWAGLSSAPAVSSRASAPPSGPVSTPGVAAAPPESGRGDRRRRFLVTLARRLAWRAVPADGPGSSDAMILLCAGLGLAVWLAFDRHAAGPGARWYAGGVGGITWYGAGLLALAWVLHRASQGTVAFRAVLAAVFGGLPLPLAVGLGLGTWTPAYVQWAGYAVLGIAALVYLQRSVARISGRRQPRAMLAAAGLAVLFAWGTSHAWVYPHVWYAAREDGEESRPWRETERLLFEQADRIDAAAARLRPPDAHRPDVFFLGFAGVGEQKVFAEEVKLSERVVSERYGAAGHTLLLVNDRRDRETWPLATVYGLRRALVRIGEHMDRSRDVLFLMLTSHGSDAPRLSVSNGMWPLEPLDGATLRAALDDSGIKWRVIVISACHSGAFIEPLADDNTIVLTSAARDRTSFGCSDQRDLTYFGAAFVRDALPRAESLESAFEQAKQAITERERREGMRASLPQARFGDAIRSYWQRVEAERRRLAPERTEEGAARLDPAMPGG